MLIEPVLGQLVEKYEGQISVYVQDDPTFPASINGKLDDTSLEFSYRNNIEIVPTLISCNDDEELARTEGWVRSEWQELTGIDSLGNELVLSLIHI